MMAGGSACTGPRRRASSPRYFDKNVPLMRARHRREGLAEVLSAADLERVLQGPRTGDRRCPRKARTSLRATSSGWKPRARSGSCILQIVHYRVSEVGDICTERPVHGGLTAFGKEVVAACNRLGILVDVAHATSAGIEQALEISAKPVISSHGLVADYEPSYTMDGARARGLHLPVAKKIAAKGGVVGFWALGRSSARSAAWPTRHRRGGQARRGARRHRQRHGRHA